MISKNSSVVRSLAAAVAVAAMAICSLPAQAEIVFGNLGASGTNAYINTSTDLRPGQWLAQGFNTGTSTNDLSVTSVTLGLFGSGNPSAPLPFTVSIYTNDAIAGDVPSSGSALYTSASVGVGNAGNYTFTFTNALLAANTKYWIVPSGGEPSAWYLRGGVNGTPIGQNGSGYTFVGTAGSDANSPTSGWSQDSEIPASTGYTVSISAVPEPSTILMAGLGIAGVAVLERGRRRRKARPEACEPDDYLG